MITYLIKVQVLLLVAAVLYMLFFSKETHFKFRRYFILLSVAFAFALPLVKTPAPLSKELSQSIVQNLPANTDDEFYIDPRLFEEQPTKKLSFSDYLWIGYLAVVIILSIKLLIQLRNIVSFIIRHRKSLRKEGGHYVAEINGNVPTFSFFNFLFLNKAHWENEEERKQILTHEIEHVKQGHTYDVILLELASITCWFNPAIYFFRSQIRAIHEYLADAKVLDETHDISYARLLVRSALSTMHLGLVNQFHNSLTLKRLSMMKTVKKNINKWKLGMLVPGIAIAVFIIACQDQLMEDMKLAAASSSIVLDYPPHITEKLAELQQKNPDAKFEYIEGEKSAIQKLLEAQYASKVIMFSEYNKETERMGVILAADGIVALADHLQTDDNVFLVVEETATPVGGMAAFYDYILKNIKYPAEARRMGIEGKVYVELTVNTDGSVSNVRVLRGIGGGCDEEALRIVSQSPAWNPGKQKGVAVRQKMVLPVVFSIGGSQNTVPTIEYKVEQTTELSTVNVVSYPNITDLQGSNYFEKDGDVYLVSDEAPTPKGGMTAFTDYVSKNMKYPYEARRRGIEGKVYIQFVVNPDGSISNVVPVRGIGGGCDEEAIRIVSNSPAWNPGKHKGELIKQRMVLPIAFELSKSQN